MGNNMFKNTVTDKGRQQQKQYKLTYTQRLIAETSPHKPGWTQVLRKGECFLKENHRAEGRAGKKEENLRPMYKFSS